MLFMSQQCWRGTFEYSMSSIWESLNVSIFNSQMDQLRAAAGSSFILWRIHLLRGGEKIGRCTSRAGDTKELFDCLAASDNWTDFLWSSPSRHIISPWPLQLTENKATVQMKNIYERRPSGNIWLLSVKSAALTRGWMRQNGFESKLWGGL